MDNQQRVTPSRTDHHPAVADTAEIPWARTTTSPTAATARPGPAAPQPRAEPSPPRSAPALAPPVWSGRKTAIAAALAIGFASVGAIGAAAALPAGSAQTDQGGRGFPGGGRFQPGGQQFSGPGQQGRPGGQVPGVPQDDDDADDDAGTT
jgi:hypothetical protein